MKRGRIGSGIYRIYFKQSEHKSYIGLAKIIGKRRKHHLLMLRHNKHANKYLQRAWNKYGEENFVFEVVERCNEAVLREREMHWVKHFDSKENGYNCTNGGEDNPMNHAKNRKAVSDALKGHKKSKEWIDKITKSRDMKKVIQTRIRKGLIKLVYVYNASSGELIDKIHGYKATGTKYNINESNVRQCVHGKIKTAKGLHYSIIEKTSDQVLKDVFPKFKTDAFREWSRIRHTGDKNPRYGKSPAWKHKISKDEMIRLYENGMTQRGIAVLAGCGNDTVFYYISKHRNKVA